MIRDSIQRCTIALLTLLLAAAPATAEDGPVDVAIVMAVDASSSVNLREFDLQMRGIADALRDNAVQRAIGGGPTGAVAITLVHWSGPLQVEQVTPWRRIVTAGDAEAAALEIEETPRRFHVGSTAIGQALLFAAEMFGRLPWTPGRRVIDISGDGRNTDKPPLAPARAAVLAEGITINGLPILAQEPDVDIYYRDQVIGGPGAFHEVARDYDAFSAAMTAKLLREIRTEPLISLLEGERGVARSASPHARKRSGMGPDFHQGASVFTDILFSPRGVPNWIWDPCLSIANDGQCRTKQRRYAGIASRTEPLKHGP